MECAVVHEKDVRRLEWRFYPNYTKPYRQCTYCEEYFGRDDENNRILLDIRDPHISKSTGRIRECNTDGPVLAYPKESLSGACNAT